MENDWKRIEYVILAKKLMGNLKIVLRTVISEVPDFSNSFPLMLVKYTFVRLYYWTAQSTVCYLKMYEWSAWENIGSSSKHTQICKLLQLVRHSGHFRELRHRSDKELQEPRLTGKEKLKTEISTVNCVSCDKCHKQKSCLILGKVRKMQ